MTDMTPSTNTDTITAGQIGKVQGLLGAALRKNKPELSRDFLQYVLETQGDALTDELLAVVRDRVQAASDMVIKRVMVDTTKKSNQEMLDATGRTQYTDDAVVADMPRGQAGETTVHFFNLGLWVSDDKLESEYAKRGLVPADPYALGAVNADDPEFADEYPNATHWPDEDGKWCFADFGRWDSKRGLIVSRREYDWPGFWWFAGVRA